MKLYQQLSCREELKRPTARAGNVTNQLIQLKYSLKSDDILVLTDSLMLLMVFIF